MVEKIKRICATCGKTFEILKSRLKWGGKFCSRYCQLNRPINKLSKKCVVCWENYEIWPYEEKRRAPTCSSKCTKIYSKNRYNKKIICLICKKEFWTSKKNPLKHCSIKCRNKSYIGKNMNGEIHICPICKKEFYVRRGILKRNQGVYCSRGCKNKVPRMSIEERIKGGGLVELECAWCGKKFVRSRFFKDIQKYCSQKCAKKSKNETTIETKTRKELEERGVYFEQEKTIKSEKKKYFVDFFLPPNVIIECNGDYWHNPIFFQKSYEKDLVKEKYLKSKGYKVYLLREKEINKNIKELIKNIIEENPEIKIGLKMNSKTKQRKKTQIIKICKYCGKEFETIPSRANTHNFCNKNCKHNFSRMNLVCVNCGKEFQIKKFYGYRKFCSYGCQKEFTKKKNTKRCKNCGRDFFPNPADIKRGKGKFCSRKCVLKYKRKDLSKRLSQN